MTTDATAAAPLDTWAVVEAMGHRTLIGRLTEVTLAGTPMLRLERIDGKGAHEFPAAAIYMLTRCTEAQARVAQARHYGYGVPAAITAALGDHDGPAGDDDLGGRCSCDGHGHEADEDGVCRHCGCETPPGDDEPDDGDDPPCPETSDERHTAAWHEGGKCSACGMTGPPPDDDDDEPWPGDEPPADGPDGHPF